MRDRLYMSREPVEAYRMGKMNGQWAVIEGVCDIATYTEERFKAKYAVIPVIPEEVAELIRREKKKANSNIWSVMAGIYYRNNHGQATISGMNRDKWICDHSDAFARAWIDLYQSGDDEDGKN